jgi:hypothetical protein
MNIDILVGRLLARCVHPFAAWNMVSRHARCMMVLSYMMAAYVTTFIGLWLTAR